MSSVHPEEKHEVFCPYCGTEASLLNGFQVYGQKALLHGWDKKNFYSCFICDALVGCHPGTTRPLGTMANRPLRKLRGQVHEVLDRSWKKAKDKGAARLRAYGQLAEKLGIPDEECHVGMFDEQRCRDALEVLR